MYMVDYDKLPWANDTPAMQDMLNDYVRNSDIFMRVGSDDVPAVRWLFDPTQKLADIPDYAQTPVAIIDYLPGLERGGLHGRPCKAGTEEEVGGDCYVAETVDG